MLRHATRIRISSAGGAFRDATARGRRLRCPQALAPYRCLSTDAHSKTSADKPPSNAMLAKMVGIGSIGGFMGSMVGLGGGVVMIPLMTAFTSLTSHQATGNSMLAVFTTGTVGALTFAAGGELNLPVSVLIATSALFTVKSGVTFGTTLSSDKLKLALAVFMVAGGALIPIEQRSRTDSTSSLPSPETEIQSPQSPSTPSLDELQTSSRHVSTNAPQSFLSLAPIDIMSSETYTAKYLGNFVRENVSGVASYTALGLGSGFLSGLLGVGGGTLLTPILTIFSDMKQQSVVGSILCAMVPASIVGVRSHYKVGSLSFHVGIPLALGACVGARVGSKSALNLPEDYLKMFCSVALLAIGGRTIGMHLVKRNLQR